VTAVEEADTASPVTDVTPEPDEPRRRPGRAWLALGAVLVAAAGAGAWAWTSNSTSAPASVGSGPVATAVVERGTITATESWDGTLAPGTAFTVSAGAGGTVTRLAEQGGTVERGEVLYRLNERPVVLLYGAVPMYRDLRPGDSGADAEGIEANLKSLGYGGFTDQAVREWQADVGLPKTGGVSSADVVFLPEGGPVDSLHVGVGDRVAPGSPILAITGTDQVVDLRVDVGDRDRFDLDTEVTVVLPDGGEVPGTVTATAVVAVPAGSGEGTQGGAAETESVAEVEIALDEQVSDDLVGASVEVVVATDRREDVLLVPVTALLALAEGGYGLEVVADDGTTSIVAVTAGLFAGGKVQVEGENIAEGTVVGVAGR
jgi:hypothetical protein